ncbi:putative membrane protein [Wickerhamomyces ciferrii]|uniref:Membrane protein n=1 Tax=Wickerhamomyces ciferrii (strain ATCC 14091 / BCRC 22168 / CBS 111 / JCM 3599 / NBRC 0793 / NRRL Y-1031 F-60-10) TaxID=1206466 RepID=K0KWT1_WICCF|nr:uncharacterized protein BN7_5150 [Wickerhamomyces ciferrii]CCH45568.1 putative membrane protein [Wickerhamomyces ciferrii]
MTELNKPIPLEHFHERTRNIPATASINSQNDVHRISNNFPLEVETNPDIKPLMTINLPKKNKYRTITTFCWAFSAGMTDGVFGSLLPFIEAYYGINYAIVSLLWLGNALGYILIGFSGHILDQKLGKFGSIMCAGVSLLSMSVLFLTGTKFPVMCIATFLGGIGTAINLGQFNVFLPPLGAKYVGYQHGCYGLGATAGPLFATLMTDHGIRWNFFYFVLLGISIFNLVLIGLTFHDYDHDLKEYSLDSSDSKAGDDPENKSTEPTTHDFKSALKNWKVWLGSVFIFFYQGSEVAMGGWVVTFIISYRKGATHSAGFISSGFWGGVTLGRFLLTGPLIKFIGSRRSIIGLCLLIIAFDILTWLVPEKIAAAVFASFAGLFIGPIIPMVITFLARILPRKIRLCSMTIIMAFGSSGGSALPFLVGMVSQKTGTYVLHPIFLASYAIMFVAWILLPNIDRKGAINTLWQRIW